ncbi:putative metal-binding motif-containing protein [Corallococcus llansteffanensis]|nr:putative metal-binding motif-containing protein [Corallococcus llansteffanensis]
MRRLLLLLPLFALAGCKDPQDGVRVIVQSTGFTPRCIKVTAEDDASKETLSTSLPGKSRVVVGIVLPEKWGKQITIKAEAFEEAVEEGKACEGDRINHPDATPSQQVAVTPGAAKDDKPQEVTLDLAATDVDGDGYVSSAKGGSDCNDNKGQGEGINPGATELCNDVDDNCVDGKDEGFNLGATCTSPDQCTGTFRCNPTNPQQNTCFTPDAQLAWLDMDRDGRGDAKQGQVVVCTAILPVDRLPQSAPHDDCDDSNAAVKPGATEVCNDIDDNCTGGPDEGFNLGGGCTDSSSSCAGTNACNVALGTAYCKPNPGSPSLYPDEDVDTFGRTAGGVISCAPKVGYVSKNGDCNDGNSFTNPDATELCDTQDNNCNGSTDESPACPNGPPSWTAQDVNTGGAALRSVALYGAGGVWVVGHDSTRAVKAPGSSSFTLIPGKCLSDGSRSDIYSVWVDTNSDTAYIGGQFGVIRAQKANSPDCKPFNSQATDTTTGLIGFVENNELQILGTASLANGTNGGTFRWNGVANNPTGQTTHTGAPLFDAHGTSLDLTFAVGGKSDGTSNILLHVPGSNTWTTQSGIPAGGTLNAVKVVHAKLAYAVGNTGTLLKWNGTEWKLEAGPGSTENFTGVLSFGANSIYITTDLGKIYQYDGATWTIASTGAGLYDIEGNNPGDIWAVGLFGRVSHFTSGPVTPPLSP